MQKADKSVMEQELREVSEQIPILLLPYPEPQLSGPEKWNHPAPRQNLAERFLSLLLLLFV